MRSYLFAAQQTIVMCGEIKLLRVSGVGDLIDSIGCTKYKAPLTNVCYSEVSRVATVCINPAGSDPQGLKVCQKGGSEAGPIISSE